MTDPEPMSPGPQAAPLALGAAVLVGVLCMLPFFFWGNPYDASVLDYWKVGGSVALVVAIIAGRLPVAAMGRVTALLARIVLRPSPMAFATIVGATTIALSVYFCFTVFDLAPSSSDEFGTLWHAKMLAHGWLKLPSDPNPEFFAIDNVIDRNGWYSHFPIGGPLALVPGIWLGVPWLVNPVLAGCSTALFYQFARGTFGELQGRAAALLLCVTPNVLMMSASYLNHVPTLFFAMIALVALVEWERAATSRRSWMWAAAIGLATGAVATLRPLDAVILAVVAGSFQVWAIRRTPSRARELLATIAGGVVGVGPLLIVNALTNGSALRFGYDVMWGEGHRVGFHADPLGQVHTLARGIEFSVRYVAQVNFSLMLWPVPAMAVVFTALSAMKRTTRYDTLVIGIFAAQVAGYSMYWGFGEFLGPRFLYTAYPAIVLLIARAPFIVGEREGPRMAHAGLAFVLACTAYAWGISDSPYSVAGAAQQVQGVRRAMRIDLAGTMREAGVRNALVFIREPLSSRLLHRLWGTGMSRTQAADLITNRDACSLLQLVRFAEGDTITSPAMKIDRIEKLATRFVRGAGNVRTRDPNVRITSTVTFGPDCRPLLDGPQYVAGWFGPALPLEPFGRDGRLDGDIIYAADLDEHNEVLRGRFASRTWYRLLISEPRQGELVAEVVPY